ncbi:alpha/beta fold hydrolase [Actinomadura atramentaria]|uniref:alpha/beta fold hydrolase n=1 Tax=Actinomadura atramentaria TaxID=1990 RepID=UPI00036F7451|nr:alpha/beta fold hydrolase [Actinomadura atramentaria]
MTVYDVVTNDEAEYGLWPAGRAAAPGWTPTGFQGSRRDCLDHVARVWTDMRPRSVRRGRSPGASRWLVRRRRRGDAALRLYCFPHSGGSPGEFVRWSDALTDVEVLGLQLPGRGARLEEPPFTDMAALVAAVVEDVEFTGPYVLFGHSLGGWVAFETIRALQASGRPLPERLVVSATPPPHFRVERDPLHRMGDDDLLDAVEQRYGGLPPTLREDPDLLALVLPAYRADFQIFEEYEHAPGDPIDVPITVVGGADDAMPADLLRAWDRHTARGADLHMLPGGHFYLRDEPGRTRLLDLVRALAPGTKEADR